MPDTWTNGPGLANAQPEVALSCENNTGSLAKRVIIAVRLPSADSALGRKVYRAPVAPRGGRHR
jgi:hypothetical protein